MAETTSSLKYIVFFCVFLIGVPSAYYLSVRYKVIEKVIFFMMVFFTVRMEDINFVSRETFRLTSKGFEIGMVDLATFVLFLLVLRNKRNNSPSMPPGAWLYVAYIVFSAVSIVNSGVVLFSFFELWKMLRMFLFFYVVYNYVTELSQIDDFLRGVAVIIGYIFYEVVKQKYLEGRFQSSGPFPHQNSLVMYSIILGNLVFSLVLNKKLRFIPLATWFAMFGLISFVVISTLSRAGMVLYAGSLLITLILSYSSGFTLNKVGVTAIIFLLSTFMLLQALDSIKERFVTAPEESSNVRKELAIAALKMVKDQPLGIGLNNFGIKINPPWQYSSHIEMHNEDDPDEKNGLVETIYLMIAAECGWHTLLVFLIFIFYYYFMNIRNLVRFKHSEYKFFSIGLIGGLLAIYVESSLEWVLKQTNNFYQLMLIFAIIAAMLKLSRKPNLGFSYTAST